MIKRFFSIFSIIALYFFFGCVVQSETVYDIDNTEIPGFAAKEGNECAMIVWDKVNANESNPFDYYLKYDDKNIKLQKDTLFFKIENLQNEKEYSLTIYRKYIYHSAESGFTTAKITPSEDKITMGDSIHNGQAVWFNLYETKDTSSKLISNNTNDGRIVWPEDLAEMNDNNRDISRFEDDIQAVENIIVRVPSNIISSLREHEKIHWWKMIKSGYHYEIYGYIYNSLLAENNSPDYEGSFPLEFTTVKELQDFDFKLPNGAKVRTKGYQTENDGGGTNYIVSERTNGRTFSTLRTKTGQIVNIDEETELSDNELNFRQLGAGHCTQITYEMRKKFPDEDFNTYTGSDSSIPKYNDDVPRLFEALDLLNENRKKSDDKIKLFVPAGEYRCGIGVTLRLENFEIYGEGEPYIEGEEFKTVNGKSYGLCHSSSDFKNKEISPYKCRSIFYTDNYYKTYWEFFFQIWGSKNLVFDKIRIEARETSYQSYYRQLVVLESENVTIQNSEIYNDENVFLNENPETAQNRQFTALTFYSGPKNCTANNNVLFNMSGVDRGASLGIMDFYGMHTENITISNNIMYQNCHDELLGVFSSQRWYKPDASVKGVYIHGNKLYPKNSGARRRTMVITLAYDDSYNIEDVVFENNFIGGEFPSNCMTFGHFGPYGVYDDTEYCTVSNNIFNLNVTSSGGVIFDSRENVSVKDNTINFVSGSNGLCTVFKRGGSFLQNTVNVDENAQISGIAYTSGPLENNTVNIFGKCSNLTSSCFSVKNNTFFIYNPISTLFALPNACEDAEISGNTVYYNINYEDDFDIKAKENGEEYNQKGWIQTHLFSSSVYPISVNPDIYPTEEHTISFTHNTVYAPNASETNKHLAYFGKGSDVNKYIISDNKVEKFTWIRSQMGGKRNIIFERNSKTSGESLKFNQEKSGKNNYIAGMENVTQNP